MIHKESVRFLTFCLVLLVLLVSGCTKPNKSLTISAFVPGSDSHKAAMAIKEVLADDGWDFTVISQTHEEGVEAVRNGKIDLAVTSNDISIDPKGLRSLIPLYDEVLVTLIHKNSALLEANTMDELLAIADSRKIKTAFSHKGSYSEKFSKRFLAIRGFTDELYESIYFPQQADYITGKIEMVKSENPDLINIVGNVDSEIIAKLMELGYLFRNRYNEIDHLEASYFSSSALKRVRSFPVIIPAYTASNNQTEAVVAPGIFTSLVSNKNLDDELVYELVRDIMRAQPELIRYNSNFFEMSEDFDARYLNYQVHPAALNYFDRDKPGFLERYAELGGVIFSMTVVLMGLLVTLNKIVNQRKKDRIDEYYLAVMEARKNSSFQEGLDKLTQLEERALNQMVDEKLAADSSYIVFLQMLNQAREELKAKLKFS